MILWRGGFLEPWHREWCNLRNMQRRRGVSKSGVAEEGEGRRFVYPVRRL
jgi:hypothetical protein